MHILGLSAYYHDSAAALVVDGDIAAAAQEERFSRKKHDARFPGHALAYCLKEGGLSLDELEYVVFYDKPLVRFERLGIGRGTGRAWSRCSAGSSDPRLDVVGVWRGGAKSSTHARPRA